MVASRSAKTDMHVELKRVYDVTDATRGYRALVDRVWPRGVAKTSLKLDEWCRDIALSTELRKWFGHDPERWEAFRLKYMDELKGKDELLEHLRDIARKRPLILLYSAKDQERNQAVVIREALLAKE
jgi:uncharacterized protein YeaO (DUF488 family)